MGSGDADILIVEDEPELVRALRINLHARQYDVRTAGTNYLRFHMARLRRNLEDNPARPRYLLTESGMGYRYQP
jgi:two-component system KDP operon response regulator KdpE